MKKCPSRKVRRQRIIPMFNRNTSSLSVRLKYNRSTTWEFRDLLLPFHYLFQVKSYDVTTILLIRIWVIQYQKSASYLRTPEFNRIICWIRLKLKTCFPTKASVKKNQYRQCHDGCLYIRQISWQNVSSQIPSWSERLGIPWCNSTWMQLLHTPEVQHKNLKMMFSKTQNFLFKKGVWPSDSRKFLSKGAHMLKFYNRHKFESSLHPPYPSTSVSFWRYAVELPSKA